MLGLALLFVCLSTSRNLKTPKRRRTVGTGTGNLPISTALPSDLVLVDTTLEVVIEVMDAEGGFDQTTVDMDVTVP